jgi:hypothetical protein
MTASSSVVISNLAYLVGAVVLAIIGGLFVWLRHRKPKSVAANVESFSRGLRALAPDGSQSRDTRVTNGSDTGRVMTALPGVRVAPVRSATADPEPSPEAEAETEAQAEAPAEAVPAEAVPAEAVPAEAVRAEQAEPVAAEPAEAEPVELAEPVPAELAEPVQLAGRAGDGAESNHADDAEAGETAADRAGAETG